VFLGILRRDPRSRGPLKANPDLAAKVHAGETFEFEPSRALTRDGSSPERAILEDRKHCS